jgi:hypothetical protein
VSVLVSVRFEIPCGVLRVVALHLTAYGLVFTGQCILMRSGAPLTDEIKSQLFCGKRIEKTRHQVVTKTSHFLPSSDPIEDGKAKQAKGSTSLNAKFTRWKS